MRRVLLDCLVVAGLLLTGTTSAGALQVAAVTPLPVGQGGAVPVDWPRVWQAFNEARIGAVDSLLSGALDSLSYVCPMRTKSCGPDAGDSRRDYFDLDSHYYFAIFPSRIDRVSPSGETLPPAWRLARVLLHRPAVEPYDRILPDVDGQDARLFEVVFFPGDLTQLDEDALAADSTAPGFGSVYEFTATSDPFTDALPGFIQKYLPLDLIRTAFADGGPTLFLVNEVPVPIRRASIKISDEFRPGGPRPVLKAVDTYHVEPAAHWTPGIVVGAAYRSRGSQNLKIDNGEIAIDAVDETLTMGVINWHPAGFQPRSSRMTAAERFRLFAAIIATPKPGFGAGIGLAFLRGLSINTGFGGLAVKTTRSGDEIGGTPGRPDDPFRTGIRWVAFLAAGFAFK